MIYASTYIPKILAANKYKAQSTWKSNIWYTLSAPTSIEWVFEGLVRV